MNTGDIGWLILIVWALMGAYLLVEVKLAPTLDPPEHWSPIAQCECDDCRLWDLEAQL